MLYGGKLKNCWFSVRNYEGNLYLNLTELEYGNCDVLINDM